MSNVDKTIPVHRRVRVPLTKEERARRKAALEAWQGKYQSAVVVVRLPENKRGPKRGVYRGG